MTDKANDIREDDDVIIHGRATQITDDLVAVVVKLDQSNKYRMQQLTMARSLVTKADPALTEHDRRIVEAAEEWRDIAAWVSPERPLAQEDLLVINNTIAALVATVDAKRAALAPQYVPSGKFLVCNRCGIEREMKVTPDGKYMWIQDPELKGWYFSTDTGWLCPKDGEQ